MTLERQILFWGLGLVGLLLIVYLLGSTITPFAAGIVLGYLLDPVVLKLQRFGFSRLGASLLILTVFVLTVVLFFILVVPVLGGQFIAFAQHLPGYAMRLQAIAVEEGNAFIAKYGGHWLDALGLRQQLSSAQIQKSVGDFVAQSAQWLLDAFTRLVSGGAALFNFLSLLIVTPVVAFYILVDWHRMIAKLDSWLPLDHRESLRNIAREINHALAGFIRGQSIVCLFLGIWYSVGLTLIGLDYGFLIGVVGGLLSFVPYVGSLTALVLSLSVALFQGWPSLKLFLLALGVVGSGSVPRRKRPLAAARRRIDRTSSGLVDVRAPCLRTVVWLSWVDHRRSNGSGDRRYRSSSHRSLPDEFVLPRQLGIGEPMMSPPRQLTFRWPHSPSFAREDFLSAPSNLDALAAVDQWPNWAVRMLMLVGPEGAGKSHLGAIWARAAGALCLAGEELDEPSLQACAKASAVLIENADQASRAEAFFFHLINTGLQNDMWLLLTSRTAPDTWGLNTPDLLSRLRLAPVVRLAAPDIELTEAVLFKLFSDRQLQVEPHVIAYIALRIERSLGAARELVAVLDNEALTQGRRITRAMASAALREMSSDNEWP